MEHYYYLHTNGELISKRLSPDPSDFTKKIWRIDTENRSDAWTVILESLALGAHIERIKDLASKWDCTAKDLVEFLVRTPEPTPLLQIGFKMFIEKILEKDFNEWCNWLEATPKGKEPNYSTMP